MSLKAIDTVEMQVIHECVDSPFYLQWLNTLGGYDYYMFQYNQVDSITTKNLESQESWNPDISVAERSEFDWINTNLQRFKLGAVNVPAEDLDGLKDLFASPIVYRVEQDATQTRIRIIKGTKKMYETSKGFNTIEVDVLMPETLLQLG